MANHNQVKLSTIFLLFIILALIFLKFPRSQPKKYYLIPGKFRTDLGKILYELGLTTGAELGVQSGNFAKELLSRWTSCQKFYLIDVWSPLKNYRDVANQPQNQQDMLLANAKKVLAPWENITVFYKMSTNAAVQKFQDNSLDFVYIDARHDYCSSKEDIENYWRKIKIGGILAGHDYMTSQEQRRKANSNIQDWGICPNGERHEGAVKRAVDEFVIREGLVLGVMYGERVSNTWMVRKFA